MPSKESPVSAARLSFPLRLALALAVAAAGVAVARDQLNAVRADVAELKAREIPHGRWEQHVDDRMDRLEEMLGDIRSAVTK